MSLSVGGSAGIAPRPGSLAGNAVQQLLSERGLSLPSKPSDVQPTLVGSPDYLDLHTADQLHIQACRWLEYVESQLSLETAKALLLKNKVKWATQTGKFRYGIKLDKWPESELSSLEELEAELTSAEAVVLVLKGVESSLQKVKVAASRTITRHVKSDISVNGGRQWTNG